MSYSAATKTWGEVAQNVRRSFGDESGVQLEENDLLRWINQGQYEIARHNRILKSRGTQNTLPGQGTYTLALGRPIEQIESIRYDGNRLVPTEFTTIDANLEEYPPSAQGEPSLWYKWGNEVTIWPTPQKSASLEVYFTATPVQQTIFDPSRVLELPDNYFLPLIDFVMAKAHEMDDDPQSQQLSTQLYAERLNSMNDEERNGQALSFQTLTIVD